MFRGHKEGWHKISNNNIHFIIYVRLGHGSVEETKQAWERIQNSGRGQQKAILIRPYTYDTS